MDIIKYIIIGIMKKRKKSGIEEFIKNYTIQGRDTEPNERVIPVEHISKLQEIIKKEIIEKIEEPGIYEI